MSIFNSVPVKVPKRSGFQMNHDVKLTFDPGYLVPVMCREIYPGDKFKVDADAFVRMMPMLAPIMQRFDLKLEAFFVPNRLIMNSWKDFITGGEDGTAEIPLPELAINSTIAFEDHCFTNGSLADYLMFPTIDPDEDIADYFGDTLQTFKVPALPFKAYQLLYNEYYRDENLTDEVELYKDQTTPLSARSAVRSLMTLRKRCWRKDYFTSALPFVQRGTEVLLPVGNANTEVSWDPTSQLPSRLYGDFTNFSGDPQDNNLLYPDKISDSQSTLGAFNGQSTLSDVQVDNSANLVVDTTNTTASINDLRRAYAVQRWKERNAVGGARYKEQLLAHFGVTVPDATIQRPLFLGAASSPVVIGEINQTSQSTSSSSPSGASVLGGFSGHGLGVNSGHLFNHMFNEHGWCIVLLSFIPQASYMQGLPRQYSRKDRYDYAFPEFAHLGEQAVYVKEIMFNFPAMPYTRDNDEVFGYQSRYAELKFMPSHVHGDFKGSLNYWHAGRIFSDSPYLNTAFVTCNPTSRIFAVRGSATDEETGEIPDVPTSKQHHLLADVAFRVSAVEPLPKFGTPI